MGGVYGRSKAGQLVQQGHYEQAVAEASAAIERDAADVESRVDRAQAYAALDRHAEAAADLEAAVRLDPGDGDIDLDFVDDSYFSALLGVARAQPSAAAGATTLDRYRTLFPRGQHHQDVSEWQSRLRGDKAPPMIIKERD